MHHVDTTLRKRFSTTGRELIPNQQKLKPVAQGEKTREKYNGRKKLCEEFDYRLKWTVCYADDIYEYWKSLELNRPLFDLTHFFFKWRSHHIDGLKYLVQKFGYNNLTLHLAIHILDTFLSKNEITKEERTLTNISCFMVAAKFEEDDRQLPSLAQLNKAMISKKHTRVYSLKEYENHEVKILRCIKFNLSIPTVATFAHFYSRTTVSLEDFHAHPAFASKFKSHEHMLAVVNISLFCFVDLTGEALFLRNTLPSQLAAACVYAARHYYKVHPNWSTAWETLTQYDEVNISAIANRIIEFYENI